MDEVFVGVDTELEELLLRNKADMLSLRAHILQGQRTLCTRSVSSPSAKELERARNSIKERVSKIKQQAW